jgi:hypothetical protein
MNIRQEVETAVAAFASEQNPVLPIAYEGVPFTKPTSTPWLEVVFLNSATMNATVDATRSRTYGTIQISCYVPDGNGMKVLDNLTRDVAALFPVFDKERYTTFSVEQPPNISSAMIDTQFRMAAVRVKYRQEA